MKADEGQSIPCIVIGSEAEGYSLSPQGNEMSRLTKFESMDEWLGIRGAGSLVACD